MMIDQGVCSICQLQECLKYKTQRLLLFQRLFYGNCHSNLNGKLQKIKKEYSMCGQVQKLILTHLFKTNYINNFQDLVDQTLKKLTQLSNEILKYFQQRLKLYDELINTQEISLLVTCGFIKPSYGNLYKNLKFLFNLENYISYPIQYRNQLLKIQYQQNTSTSYLMKIYDPANMLIQIQNSTQNTQCTLYGKQQQYKVKNKIRQKKYPFFKNMIQYLKKLKNYPEINDLILQLVQIKPNSHNENDQLIKKATFSWEQNSSQRKAIPLLNILQELSKIMKAQSKNDLFNCYARQIGFLILLEVKHYELFPIIRQYIVDKFQSYMFQYIGNYHSIIKKEYNKIIKYFTARTEKSILIEEIMKQCYSDMIQNKITGEIKKSIQKLTNLLNILKQ